MKKALFFLLSWLCIGNVCMAHYKHWTVNDGLLTSEVHQIVELPNGQIFVNCEGAFLLCNGQSFLSVDCDRSRSLPLNYYGKDYGHLWQGDSLLWLRDFYYLYLFDVRTRSFQYDIESRLADDTYQRFARGETGSETKLPEMQARLDSIRPGMTLTTSAVDRQGGIWIGTRHDGIMYCPPDRQRAQILPADPDMVQQVRSITDSKGRIWAYTNQGLVCYDQGQIEHYQQNNIKGFTHNHMHFITELPDGRLLLCILTNKLGYFDPQRREFVNLSDRLPQLNNTRYIAGACVMPEPNRVAIYTQNGIFLLNTEADTIMPFPQAKEIERHSTKYNCMLVDSHQRIWIGTQNGLFLYGEQLVRIEGIANDCIRSLIEDAEGNIWAGTSCGVSRITPSVFNYDPTDGIPRLSLLEREAGLLPDGRLIFVFPGGIISFHPDWLTCRETSQPVVLTALRLKKHPVIVSDRLSMDLPYHQNYVGIEFSALNYANPSHTRYRYRLRGLENDWVMNNEGTGVGVAYYTALAPGIYTFEVQAAVCESEWGSITTLAITVRPPFWLTWWAKIFYVLLFLTALFLLGQYYTRKKRKKLERENDERVNHLFELREEACHQFARSVNISPEKITINIEEEMLVTQLLKIIETNIDNEEYNVDMLARDVGMSRANLYKKTQTILGITPADFIRNVRLKRASLLLSDTQLSISEIANRVGFATTRNFSTTFKKMFGVTPSEYNRGKKDS